jgi:hypothetical protein
MAMATSKLAALAIAGATAAAVAGCGAAGHAQPAHSARASFAWLNQSSPPNGWLTARIASGAALSYPPGWTRIHGDRGTATVALLGPGHQYLGYLNITPRQGPESLANFARFRVDHNGDEGDSAIRTQAATTQRRFGAGHASCVQDSYGTKAGARYIELACLIAGPRTSVVVVGAGTPQSWPRVSPLLQRAISSTTA